MSDAISPDNKPTPVGNREWVKAAVWIGGILLVLLASVLVIYNLALCGCETRPAALMPLV
jgi:hypothetical protein